MRLLSVRCRGRAIDKHLDAQGSMANESLNGRMVGTMPPLRTWADDMVAGDVELCDMSLADEDAT